MAIANRVNSVNGEIPNTEPSYRHKMKNQQSIKGVETTKTKWLSLASRPYTGNGILAARGIQNACLDNEIVRSCGNSNRKRLAEMLIPVTECFEKTAWFRNEISERGPGARAQLTDYGITTASYSCITRALGKLIPDEVRNNSDAPLVM